MQATIVLSRGEAVLQVVSEGHAEAQLLGELERQIERSGPHVHNEWEPREKAYYLRLRARDRAQAGAPKPEEPAARPEPAPAAETEAPVMRLGSRIKLHVTGQPMIVTGTKCSDKAATIEAVLETEWARETAESAARPEPAPAAKPEPAAEPDPAARIADLKWQIAELKARLYLETRRPVTTERYVRAPTLPKQPITIRVKVSAAAEPAAKPEPEPKAAAPCGACPPCLGATADPACVDARVEVPREAIRRAFWHVQGLGAGAGLPPGDAAVLWALRREILALAIRAGLI